PIVFLGYYNNQEATDKTISKEGILYTGDMGYFKKMEGYEALYLSGRKKFVIKQKGYQVFPAEVEAHILQNENIAEAVAVGVKHAMFDEGIFVYVKPKPGKKVTPEEVLEQCKNIASYKRPHHVELWPEDKLFPLNRVAKVDVVEVQKLAAEVVHSLREKGGWDC
ncbi:MAG: AMP-binding protein, partial [Cyclobacteriaceae bacterium]|nr:AMP-binding protein [Cyclobacteriaceae bacterium]